MKNLDLNLNLENVSMDTLEKKYFELIEIQHQLREFQLQIEGKLFPEYSLPF